MSHPHSRTQGNATEVLQYFLKLGLLGFGGPLAMIAAIQKDLVEGRKWIDKAEFAQAFALIKAMPGPVAFQLAVYLGRKRAGPLGGLAAFIGLVGPAALLMVLFGYFYSNWRELKGADQFLLGMQSASLGVVVASVRQLASAYYKKWEFWLWGSVAIFVTLNQPSAEPLVIVGCGAATALMFILKANRNPIADLFNKKNFSVVATPLFEISSLRPFLFGSPLAGALIKPNMFDLVWSCFKSGAFVFGSGLAIVPLMRDDFVTHLGWLSNQEFMDALAFGQITPGPVVITATFIGFKSLGLFGAFAATAAIFAAPFFHMMTWFPIFLGRMAKLRWLPSFLLGSVAAVVGSILTVTFHLAWQLEHPGISWPLIFGAFLTSAFTKTPTWLVIPAGGLLSILFI